MGGQAGREAASRTAISAVVVLLGCAVGAEAGTWLRFPSVGPAVLFPPYAIVTVVLWRSAPRRWWIFLLAASAGSFVPHRLGGASVAFVLLAELVNHLRALLAAIALRRFAGRDGRLQTMRELVAYLAFAVIVAPGLAALAGALLVTRLGSAGAFGLAWQQWWLSNASTALTLLPLLTLDLRQVGARLARVPARRVVEAASLAAALVAAGLLMFASAYDRPRTHQVHLYWAVPFLLWAAVRFGPRATSAALLWITALSIVGAMEGRGPFASQSPTENLLELQVFLLAVSVPLLLLTALIEQQRLTAAALRESRRQYRSVVEDQTEMICRFGPDGTYTFANRAYGDAFGRAPDSLVGGSIWSLVPSDVHRSRAELALMTPESPIATREVNLAGPGEAPRWQQWRDRAFFDEQSAVVEYQAVGRDVTDRKRAEDEHRELQARKSVEAALREADRHKDEFLAMLGHELRNPLAPIGTAVEILRVAPPGGPEVLWARESIGRQLRHLTRLLDDLLDISRIKLGRIRLQVSSVDLGRVVAGAVEEARALIASQRHDLTVTLPEAPVLVRGDAARLTQVVANLLNNAAKYTGRGGRIGVTLTRDDRGVRLAVHDTGIGIASDALEQVFGLFTQLPDGRERTQGGLGVGLHLVRQLVELHGGTVEARSDGPGRGTEMVVRLPSSVLEAGEPAAAVAE